MVLYVFNFLICLTLMAILVTYVKHFLKGNMKTVNLSKASVVCHKVIFLSVTALKTKPNIFCHRKTFEGVSFLSLSR